MDVETRIKALEERLAETETVQRSAATATQTLFDYVKRIDENVAVLVPRASALEQNFSLVNAAINNLAQGMDAVRRDVASILEFLKNPNASQPH